MSPSLSDQDKQFVCELVHRRAAIVLDESKYYLIENRLHQAAVEAGMRSAVEVVQLARAGGPSSPAQTRIVEAITTHETSFFRDAEPFEALKNAIIPGLLQANPARPITIWSAACSSGQEPYSIAMMLCEAFPQLVNGRVRIIATDISGQILERAREGVFRQLDVNRGLPAAMTVKYFDRTASGYAIKPEVKRLVTFKQMNLLEDWSGIPSPDIVFMRYVLIYFDIPTKRQILNRLGAHIARDGAVILGATETTINIDDSWERKSFGRVAYYGTRS